MLLGATRDGTSFRAARMSKSEVRASIALSLSVWAWLIVRARAWAIQQEEGVQIGLKGGVLTGPSASLFRPVRRPRERPKNKQVSRGDALNLCTSLLSPRLSKSLLLPVSLICSVSFSRPLSLSLSLPYSLSLSLPLPLPSFLCYLNEQIC